MKYKLNNYSDNAQIDLILNNKDALLKEDGLLLIASYRAHEGGYDEFTRIIEKIKSLNYEIRDCYDNNECLIIIRK